VSGGELHAEAAAGLLPVPHLHPDLSDRHHVLDLVLDQTGSRARQGHPGGHLLAHPLHAARQLAEVAAPRLLHQGKNIRKYPPFLQLKFGEIFKKINSSDHLQLFSIIIK